MKQSDCQRKGKRNVSYVTVIASIHDAIINNPIVYMAIFWLNLFLAKTNISKPLVKDLL